MPPLLPLLLLAAAPVTGPVEVVPRDKQPVHAAKGIEATLLVENSGSVYLGRLRFAPGASVAKHRHEASEELLTIVRGTGTMTVGSKTVTVRPGDAVRIPAGAWHDFTAGNEEPVEIIQVYSPKGPESRFREWPTP